MVEIHVQHARQPQLRQVRQLHPQRPRCELELSAQAHQVGERGAFERDGVTRAQGGEIDAVAMKARHHGEARQAALRGLALQDHRRAPGDGEVEHRRASDYTRPATDSSGSKIHWINDRRSIHTSASSSMPERSARL